MGRGEQVVDRCVELVERMYLAGLVHVAANRWTEVVGQLVDLLGGFGCLDGEVAGRAGTESRCTARSMKMSPGCRMSAR